MPKEKLKDARIQVNISPSPATLEKLDDLVIRFGERHKNVKNRNVAAADILDKFVDVYVYLVEETEFRPLRRDSLCPSGAAFLHWTNYYSSSVNHCTVIT